MSWAVTSVPSLIAFMNAGGVIRFRPERRRQQREDALRRAHRHARVTRADVGDQPVVGTPGRASRSCPALGEIARVRGSSRFRSRAHRLSHRRDVGGAVPAVRVVAVLQPQQCADVQDHARRRRVGGEQLGRPGVVADAVDDGQLGRGQRAGVSGRGLVGVRVRGGVGDDALDVRPGRRRAGRRCCPRSSRPPRRGPDEPAVGSPPATARRQPSERADARASSAPERGARRGTSGIPGAARRAKKVPQYEIESHYCYEHSGCWR